MSEDFLDEAKKAGSKKAEDQRAIYDLKDFIFDAYEGRYWNLKILKDFDDKSTNSMVPRDKWETEVVPGRNGSVREVVIKPSNSIARIERDSVVECSTWWPGKPRIIKDIIVGDQGDMPAKGCRMLNTYVEPHIVGGQAPLAALWVEHIRRLWPDDAEILLDYFAHTIQHPETKINYGIVLVGEPGIGKDLMLLPVRNAVGENNSAEISPDDLNSPYNSYATSILTIINEARPVNEDFKATDFYERLKVLTAAPPNWIKMNGKYQKQRYVRNLLRIIITTNDPLALYVPDNDRRLHFAVSKLSSQWATPDYFTQLDAFYKAGGYAHVYTFLKKRDLSKFNPNEKPKENAAHMSAVASWNAPISDPLMDVLDGLGWPPMFFGNELLLSEVAAFDNKDEVVKLLRSSRKLAGMMSRHGYDVVQSSNKKSGWQFYENGKRFKARVAFVRRDFTGDVEAALEFRGREIAANGKAARPKVVPLKSV